MSSSLFLLVISTQIKSTYHRVRKALLTHSTHFEIEEIEAIPEINVLLPTHLGPLSPVPPVGHCASAADIKVALQAHASQKRSTIADDKFRLVKRISYSYTLGAFV